MATYNPINPLHSARDMDDRSHPSLAGLPLQEAIATVSESRDIDKDQVSDVLQTVAEDGIITRDGVQARLAHVAKLVATPESRVEFAQMELREAQSLAEPVAEQAAIAARIEPYETRLERVESRVESLQTTLQDLTDRADSGPIFEVARELNRLGGGANDVQRMADELYTDLQAFQDWLGNEETRRTAFAGELDLVEDKLDDLTSVCAAFEADRDPAEPGLRWLDATLRSRVVALLLRDLRAEAVTLRAWAQREGKDLEAWDEFETRLEDLEERHESLRTDLEAVADPAWPERFADRLDGFTADVESEDPPIDWATVQSAFKAYRPNVDPGTLD